MATSDINLNELLAVGLAAAKAAKTEKAKKKQKPDKTREVAPRVPPVRVPKRVGLDSIPTKKEFSEITQLKVELQDKDAEIERLRRKIERLELKLKGQS